MVHRMKDKPEARMFDAVHDDKKNNPGDEGKEIVGHRGAEIDIEKIAEIDFDSWNSPEATIAAERKDKLYPAETDRFSRGERSDEEIKSLHAE